MPSRSAHPSSPVQPPDPRCPVTLVAGWYGAGKTTLATALADHEIAAGGHPLRVTSGVGVDATHPDDSDREVVATEECVAELELGCPQCAVRVDLVTTLPHYTSRNQPPTTVIVEITGAGDVVTAAQSLLGDAEVRRSSRLDGIVTLVDGQACADRLRQGEHLLPSAEAIDQVAVADRLIVTGVADLHPRLADAVCWNLRGLNRFARLHLDDRPDRADLLAIGGFDPLTVADRLARLSLGHWADEESGVSAAVVHSDGCLDPDDLMCWIDHLHHAHGSELLRLHGVFSIEGEARPWVVGGLRSVVDFDMGAAPDDIDGSRPRTSRLAVVGRNLDLARVSASFEELSRV